MIDCHKNDGLLRAILFFFMWIFLISNWSYFYNYQSVQAAEEKFKAGKKVAMVYANPTFHDEVVSSVACTLKDEGFFVTVYIGNGLHVGTVMIPMSGKRQRYSESFYGHCVDKFITITDPISEENIVKDPDLLVFVTYPMLKHNFVHDQQAIQLLRSIKENKSSASVCLITHRANEAMHETLPIVEQYVDKDRLTFVFLGEHTKMTTKNIMEGEQHKATTALVDASKGGTDTPKIGSYRLAHFYPVVPFDYIGKSRTSGEAYVYDAASVWSSPPVEERSSDGWPLQTFAIQGNFGGKHAHRKDVKGTVECLQRVESSYEEDKTLPKTPMKREDKPVAGKTPLRVSLELIGHLTDTVSLPSLLYGHVRFLSDLAPVYYYRAISRVKFMIAAVGEEDYYTARATSSVPAALITGVPLVANTRFLNVYPCLRDSKVHKEIAHDTECESIAAAARLSAAEYEEAVKEVKKCATEMYEHGRQLFKALGEEASKRRSKAKTTGAGAIFHES